MAEAFRGAAVTGTGTTYVTPRDGPLTLDLLTFTVATSSAASLHAVQVSIYDPTVAAVVAVLAPSSVAGPSQTVSYTYGVGLHASATRISTGMSVTEPLPVTMLAPQTSIILTAVDAVGATIAGDVFSAVYLYGDIFTTDAGGSSADLLPGLLPAQAAG